LLILHGLEGTINSHYLRGTLSLARKYGWPTDVLMFRGCNGELNRARRLYHSGETTDLSLVVNRLIETEPDRPLVLAGFSLGGNVLLKWLGEMGERVPKQVRAAAAVSVPFDLERGCRHIERGFSRIYNWHFLRTLKTKAAAKLVQYPDLYDAEALRSSRTLYEFDDAVTAPLHGFKDAHDYYSRSSSIGYLSDIRTPTLLVSSFDDPFLPREVLVSVAELALKNPKLETYFTARGGHVGFVSGRHPRSQRFHAEDRVMEYLSLCASDSR
jgi:predicted alpha/beta-fold hydrolase